MLSLAIVITTFNISSFAGNGGTSPKPVSSKTVASTYKKVDTGVETNKSTMADYERQKCQGKKFSTTQKVLIGAGIAGAITVVVLVLANRDVKNRLTN